MRLPESKEFQESYQFSLQHFLDRLSQKLLFLFFNKMDCFCLVLALVLSVFLKFSLHVQDTQLKHIYQ